MKNRAEILKYFFCLMLFNFIFSSCNDYPAVTTPSVNSDSIEHFKHGFDSLLKLNNSTYPIQNPGSSLNSTQKRYFDSTDFELKIKVKHNFMPYPLIIEPDRTDSFEARIFAEALIKNMYSLGTDRRENIKPELKSSSIYSYSKIINPLGLFYLKYKFNKTYYRELRNNLQNK